MNIADAVKAVHKRQVQMNEAIFEAVHRFESETGLKVDHFYPDRDFIYPQGGTEEEMEAGVEPVETLTRIVSEVKLPRVGTPAPVPAPAPPSRPRRQA